MKTLELNQMEALQGGEAQEDGNCLNETLAGGIGGAIGGVIVGGPIGALGGWLGGAIAGMLSCGWG